MFLDNNSGQSYTDWLNAPDSPEDASKIESFYASTSLSQEAVTELSELQRTVNIIAIAETWCGDVMRHVPLLQKIVEATDGKIQLKFISRENAAEFFLRFLTNGGEALPKFVFCNDQFTEVGNWGPMPEAPKRYIAEGKAEGDVPAARKKVSAFYKENNGTEATQELLALIRRAALTALPE